MPALGIANQEERLRRTVQNALEGCTYESSKAEAADATLVLEARRRDGSVIALRFRGVKDSLASVAPEVGSALRFRTVDRGGGLLSALTWLLPIPAIRMGLPRVSTGYLRVRIEAGAAQLDIVCQDAEWWQVADAPGGEVT